MSIKTKLPFGKSPVRTGSCGKGERGADPIIFSRIFFSSLKIGLLAKVEDDKVASALSWHMSSDMDCIVTTTTAKVTEKKN